MRWLVMWANYNEKSYKEVENASAQVVRELEMPTQLDTLRYTSHLRKFTII